MARLAAVEPLAAFDQGWPQARDDHGEGVSPRFQGVQTRGSNALTYTFVRTVTMHYVYTNRQPGPVEIWLSLPPELPTQRQVQVVDMQPEPVESGPDGLGINHLAFFRLAPGEILRFDVQADLYRCAYDPTTPATDIRLSEEERRRFLRSSPMIRVTEEVQAEARRIVGDAATSLEQARRLYRHLVRQYRYKWPPPARGSEAMRRHRQGDCGEFSFLYAAWCRAIGIPCRVMVGTFAHGALQAHVWNEVFIQGIGWLPVDASRYSSRIHLPGLNHLDWWLQRVERRFGTLPDERLVFSIDPDVVLQPPYRDHPPPEVAERMPVAGRELAWGFESLDGGAPYLQPIYIRFDPAAYRPPGNTARLENVLASLGLGLPGEAVELYLGRWHFRDPLLYRVGNWAMVGGFLLGATGTLLGSLELGDLGPWGALGYSVANALYIQRTGVRWWKLLLLALFLLELLVYLVRFLSGAG